MHMLAVSDMQAKGQLSKGHAVEWAINVDPSIKGGVVYNIGDVMVDASVKALQDQFFQQLEQAGVKRVD
jgi:F0F1-type ATP synthase delta subunit